MKRFSKLILSVMLACTLLISVMPLQVEAALTKPETVNDEYVIQRLCDLARKLGINEGNFNEGQGKYFTTHGNPCIKPGVGRHGKGDEKTGEKDCPYCKNEYVIKADWFKALFGEVPVGGLPKQYETNGESIGHTGWSCFGFANFALWYATSTSSTDNVIGTLVGVSTFTKENIEKMVRPGYIIRCNNHSMIYLSSYDGGIRVMDCNWGYKTYGNCRVTIHNLSYTAQGYAGKKMAITRAGNHDSNAVQGPDTTKPIITNVRVGEVSNQGYTVYCDATDNVGVLKVSFATWTDYNGQDDLKNEWWDKNAVMQPISGNTYAFRVNTADHNEEAGLYTTDVYAYDTNYNYVMQRVQVTIDKSSPIISYYIENVDATGYTVVCKAIDDVEMARVCFPTWTTANGQDDLNPDWYNNCAVVGKGNDGVYTYRVNVSDHNNESGEYETHIYAYDTSGNYIRGKALKAQVPKGLPFPDVKPGAWYYNSVTAVYEAGLMNGRADGTFGPNLNLTRAEVATVLYNKENKPYVAYVNRFSDVKDGMWYSAPISWAYRKGIASGYGNGKFGVGDNISREQMAQMLYAYAKMKGYDISYTEGSINQYSDSAKVSSWAKPAMNWAISKGIMSGKGSGSDLSKYKLEPQGSTTRAECAAMLKNFMDAYGR